MKNTTRSLLLAIVASAMLVCASQSEPIGDHRAIQIRAGIIPVSSVPVLSQLSTTAQSSTQAQTSTDATSSTAPTTTSSSLSSSASSSSSSAASKSETSSPAASATTLTSAGSTPTPTTQAVVSSAVATTNSAGEVVTSYVEYTLTPSSATPSPTQTSNNSSGSSSGLSTGSIVGLSVAGGIAAIGIILFFVWKFTRKRFADFDDNEAIKWPELNAHNNDVHALPTNSTGRSGFGPENDSDVNLTRAPSPGAYANSIGAASVPEVYGAGDPYAVPPLPHLNPNQPYRDDPGAYGQPAGYYDPYRGPVPNTFADTMADGPGAEAIPMTQMARMRSPGSQVAYDMQGRSSPAPQAAMGYAGMDERSRTPNPAASVAGRGSPSPHPGYGYGPR